MLELECQDPFTALALVRREPWVVSASLFGRTLHLLVEGASDAKTLLGERLRSAGLAADRMEVIPFTLEDAFVRLIDKEEQQRTGSNA
jgi:hypothetical protein